MLEGANFVDDKLVEATDCASQILPHLRFVSDTVSTNTKFI